MRNVPQIFTSLQRQRQPIDPGVLLDIQDDHVMSETASKIRRLIENVLAEDVEVVRAGKSPLVYNRAGNVQRLSLVDPDAGEPGKHDNYFARIERWRKWHNRGPKRGTALKKPVLDEVIPGAAPGTVAFLDYHDQGYGSFYIDYMKTRDGTGGRGYARKLLEEFFRTLPDDVTYVDFGRMMSPAIGHLFNEFKKRFEGKITLLGHHDYGSL